MRWIARRDAHSVWTGSTPRSKRYEESDASPSAREVRRICVFSNCALSSRTLTVRSEISVSSPPMMPATATGRSASAMTSIAGLSLHCVPSIETIVSPSAARRTTMRPPRSLSKSKAWSGWPHSNMT